MLAGDEFYDDDVTSGPIEDDYKDLCDSQDSQGPTEWTDSAVAEAFARHIAGEYVYVGEWRQWYRWDDRRWAIVRAKAVYEIARQWIDAEREVLIDRHAPISIRNEARKYANKARIDAVVGLARRINCLTTVTYIYELPIGQEGE